MNTIRLEDLKDHLVGGGRVERAGNRARLVLPPTSSQTYADAQLDNYPHALPRVFISHPPLRLCVRVRCSHPAGRLKGTAGFGFWNHPFTRGGDVIAPPQHVWFFYNSPESDLALAPGMPGWGLKASVLNASRPGITRLLQARGAQTLANAVLRLPLVREVAAGFAKHALRAREAPISLDLTEWHAFELDWRPDAARFSVDGIEVLRAAHPPSEPLGFVAWIDNYRASTRRHGFAFVETTEVQWVELEWE
ncbi:MAG: hypothetical protein NZ693_00115 [Thermoflexales bacterium]|nr:hypothetical protein [Thermoflexales bacterium]